MKSMAIQALKLGLSQHLHFLYFLPLRQFMDVHRDVGQGHAGHAMACPVVGTLKLSGHQSLQKKKRKRGEGRRRKKKKKREKKKQKQKTNKQRMNE